MSNAIPRSTRRARRPTPLAAALLGSMLASGVAGAAGAAVAGDGHHDPLEKLNRATYAFNDALDRMLARPAAKAYQAVVPRLVQEGVSNFVGNLGYPKVVINSALQGKFHDAATDLERLLVNTILGVGGIGDPATHFGIPVHEKDFGQTLGRWGVPAGPYLVIPVLGPSDLRDAPARYVIDRYFAPTRYLKSSKVRYGLDGLTLLDKRVGLLAADSAVQSAFDPYALVRDAFQQRREYVIHDGVLPDASYDEPADLIDAVPGEPGEPGPAEPMSTGTALPKPDGTPLPKPDGPAQPKPDVTALPEPDGTP